MSGYRLFFGFGWGGFFFLVWVIRGFKVVSEGLWVLRGVVVNWFGEDFVYVYGLE